MYLILFYVNKKKINFLEKIPFLTEICIYIWLTYIIYTIIYTIIYMYKY